MGVLMTIREKLKALTAPCREVDAEIAVMFDFYEHKIGKREVRLWDGTWRSETWRPVPKFTSSLDATVELVEREMPDARYGWERIHTEHWAFVGQGQQAEAHKLPAVALLLALMDAKGIE